MMTFHDETHHLWETTAFTATNTLLLWLQTISPYSGIEAIKLQEELLKMAENLEWDVIEDENGIKLLKEHKNELL